MKQKAGTTEHWRCPWCALYELSTFWLQWVDVFDVLTKTKMAQSRAEGRRLLQQGRVWDLDYAELSDYGKIIHTPSKLCPNKHEVLVEPGNRWVIGKPVFINNILDLTQGKIILFYMKSRKSSWWKNLIYWILRANKKRVEMI